MKLKQLLCMTFVLSSCGKENITNIEDNFKRAEKHEIYSTCSGEIAWTFDVSDPNLVKENAYDLIEVKVLEIGESTFEYTSHEMPVTPIRVEVLNGEIDIHQVIQLGGVVSMSDIEKIIPEEQVVLRGWDDISDDEKKNTYLKYELGDDFEFTEGNVYLLAVKKGEDNQYYLSSNGYSVFEKNADGYKNVVTGKVLDI